MSADPKRWFEEDGGSTDEERVLLRAAGDGEPPVGAQDAIWMQLAVKVPVPPGGGEGGSGGSAAGLSTGAKAVALGAVGVGVAVAVTLGILGRSSAPSDPSASSLGVPSIAVPSATATPSMTARAAPPTVAIADLPVIVQSASSAMEKPRTSPAPVPSGDPMDALVEERGLLASARAAHRRGDDRAALATLATASARYPNGVLSQEREVLAIESLAQMGDRDTASERAKVFLRVFPKSLHANHVREFVK